MLKPGLYEKIINKELEREIKKADGQVIDRQPVDGAESPKVLSSYLASILEAKFMEINDTFPEEKQNEARAKLINSIVELTKGAEEEGDANEVSTADKIEELLSVVDKQNNIIALDEKRKPVRPETSIAHSSLFTGAKHEPSMFSELKKEIVSANQIDMLVSFVKWSGLRQMLGELREFTNRGGRLRVITTSYMGATDPKAVEELGKLANTQVRISYDTKSTRLHAKSYIFKRDTGYTTAYVGSSNMSNAALSSGLEWNVKVTKADQPEVVKKISATFEAYWNSAEFTLYSEENKDRLETAIKAEKYKGKQGANPYIMDVTPYAYQQEILDQLKAEREIRNHFRNLVVAATGTGKTVVTALDYKRVCQEYNGGRYVKMLFVAHREEILEQSIETFREVLKDPDFGDLMVGKYQRPDQIDQLFISIQTFQSKDFTSLTSADNYDYIVVDEFHHAAAKSYQKLLTYYKPLVLLGLTATPERMDGKSILTYFNNRIAAEIRLPEAIDRKMLCPVQYFGVTDTVDLSKVKWVNGRYDVRELSNIYSMSGYIAEKRADWIIKETLRYVTDINEVKGLGFCVTKEHAAYMADYFNNHGIPALCLTSDSNDEERETAKARLEDGEIKFIFVVDLYNEGVDIKPVNTVLFLRPTESLTIFLQQLGRGLRLAEGKDCLTVLDFVGQANKKYNFEEKFAALLSDKRTNVISEIKNDFVHVPRGCYIHLEKKAKEYILQNIKQSFDGMKGIVTRIQLYAEETSDKDVSLEGFLEHYHLDIHSVYAKNFKYSFERMCVNAGVKEDFIEEKEEDLTTAFKRVSSIDSRRWLKFLLEVLPSVEQYKMEDFKPIEIRMLNMFQYTIWGKSHEAMGFTNQLEGIRRIKANPRMFAELLQILQYNLNHIDFVDEKVDIGFDSPLDLYCHYTRDQIFVAMDYMKPETIRQGVFFVKDKKADVFINTLNKAAKDYSPTTMYNDYSINEWLFHWQSQSTTAEKSPTGQRYINHDKEGSNVLLFVREYNDDMSGTAPFMFLGKAHYVSHEGSKPMNIIWKLEKPIPAKFIGKTGKMMVQ